MPRKKVEETKIKVPKIKKTELMKAAASLASSSTNPPALVFPDTPQFEQEENRLTEDMLPIEELRNELLGSELNITEKVLVLKRFTEVLRYLDIRKNEAYEHECRRHSIEIEKLRVQEAHTRTCMEADRIRERVLSREERLEHLKQAGQAREMEMEVKRFRLQKESGRFCYIASAVHEFESYLNTVGAMIASMPIKLREELDLDDEGFSKVSVFIDGLLKEIRSIEIDIRSCVEVDRSLKGMDAAERAFYTDLETLDITGK